MKYHFRVFNEHYRSPPTKAFYKELDRLRVGQSVKIFLAFTPLESYVSTPAIDHVTKTMGDISKFDCERPWATVESIEADGTYKVKIDNDLVFTESHGLMCDDIVTIKRENIFDITG